MIIHHIFYRVAFLTTAVLHLWWNDLVKAVISIATLCLSNPGQPILQSILRLHSLVLMCFVMGFCFKTVSASHSQMVLPGLLRTLNVRTLLSSWNLTRFQKTEVTSLMTSQPKTGSAIWQHHITVSCSMDSTHSSHLIHDSRTSYLSRI